MNPKEKSQTNSKQLGLIGPRKLPLWSCGTIFAKYKMEAPKPAQISREEWLEIIEKNLFGRFQAKSF